MTRSQERQAKILTWADKLCVGFVAAAYLAYLVFLFATTEVSQALLVTLCVPALSYIALGALRAAINAPRPYDDPTFTPLLPPNKTGKSFPSRHVSSGAVISLTIMATCLPLGVACLAATVALAFIRVIGGLHFPRDVLAGFFLGASLGLISHVLLLL